MPEKYQVKFQVNLESCWIRYSAALAGLCIFLQTVCGVGLQDVTEFGTGQLLLQLIIPIAAETALIVLVYGLRLKQPMAYCCVGTVFCVLMVISDFSSANRFFAVLSLIWYILAAAALILTGIGYLPSKYIVFGAFMVPVVFRLIVCGFFEFVWNVQILEGLSEAAVLALLICISLFSLGLVPKK